MDKSTIKYWVFKGGGVLGNAYRGVANAATELGIYDQAIGVAGTSAGSLTALPVALKYSAVELDKLWSTVNFKSFKDGFNPFNLIRKYGVYKGDVLFKFIQKQIKERTGNPNSTFADLNRLGFLDLVVYACDHTTGLLVQFSYKTTPNTIVAEAVMGSASIPEYFCRRLLTAGEYKGHYLIDGGVMDNYAITTFDDSCGCSNDEVLGFFLHDVNAKKTYKPVPAWRPIWAIERTFNMLMDSQDVNVLNDPSILKRTIIIDTHGISATNFNITPQETELLIASGKSAMLNKFK